MNPTRTARIRGDAPAAGILLAALAFAWAISSTTSTASAASTISDANRFAYGANFGWIDFRPDDAPGAVVGAFTCSGFLYSANVGWIQIGSGAPANGVRYQNNSSTDYGVNHDGAGHLHGYAFSANIGWLTFTNRDATGTAYAGPQVDLLTGRLDGFVWSANAGWISLSNQFALVQTTSIAQGTDADGDGLPDAWELQFAATLAQLHGQADDDGDGATNRQEYEADTNPLDATSVFRLVRITKPEITLPTRLEWKSSPSRLYRIHASTDLPGPSPWPEVGLGLIPGAVTTTTTRDLPPSAAASEYFQVEALLPLSR